MTTFLTRCAQLASALVKRRLVVVTVRGASMEPAHHDGDRVLVRRDAPLLRGAVIVVERPTLRAHWPLPPVPPTAGPAEVSARQWMIKRIAALPGDPVPPDLANLHPGQVPPGHLLLLGDNHQASLDSRQLGYFPATRVLGPATTNTRPRAS
jgi:signal peptidase I